MYLVFGKQGVVLETKRLEAAQFKVSQDASLNIIKSKNPKQDKRMINSVKFIPGAIQKITYEVFEDGKTKTIEINPDNALSVIRNRSISISSNEHPYDFSNIDKKEVVKLFAKNDRKGLIKLFDGNNVYRICTSCDDRADQIYDIFKEALKNKWI